MKIIRVKDFGAMSRFASKLIEKQIVEKENAVLGLATGSSPLGIYENLADACGRRRISFKRVKGFNLDEYRGLEKSHIQSFYHYLKVNLLDKTDFEEKNLYVLDGMAENIEAACEAYEEMIEAAEGIDLQLLGLGVTGHIGFNEPYGYFPDRTHMVKLKEETVRTNARFFTSPQDVPEYAVTMGIGTIMRAKKIILVVSGEGKAEILNETLYGKVRPQIPAGILQFHRDVTVIADEGACSVIRRKNVY